MISIKEINGTFNVDVEGSMIDLATELAAILDQIRKINPAIIELSARIYEEVKQYEKAN